MKGGILSPDQVVSSHILVLKQLNTAQNGLFWQFLPIWHSVEMFSDCQQTPENVNFFPGFFNWNLLGVFQNFSL